MFQAKIKRFTTVQTCKSLINYQSLRPSNSEALPNQMVKLAKALAKTSHPAKTANVFAALGSPGTFAKSKQRGTAIGSFGLPFCS